MNSLFAYFHSPTAIQTILRATGNRGAPVSFLECCKSEHRMAMLYARHARTLDSNTLGISFFSCNAPVHSLSSWMQHSWKQNVTYHSFDLLLPTAVDGNALNSRYSVVLLTFLDKCLTSFTCCNLKRSKLTVATKCGTQSSFPSFRTSFPVSLPLPSS
jgi:hypothetical protein